MLEPSSGDNTHHEIGCASQSQQRTNHGNSGEYRMHGELFRVAEPQKLPRVLTSCLKRARAADKTLSPVGFEGASLLQAAEKVG